MQRNNQGESQEVQLQNETSEAAVLDDKDSKFQKIIETIYRIVDRLQNINTLCNPLFGGPPHVNPGAHELDIAHLDSERQHLRSQIDAFRQLVETSKYEFFPQLAFLSHIDGIIRGQELRTICFELKNVVDQGNMERVKEYGNLAGSLLQQIDVVINKMHEEVQRNENAKKANEKIIQQINSDTQQLFDHYTVETSREVIRKFRFLLVPVYGVMRSLENISIECIVQPGETPSISPGTLDPDFSGIKIEQSRFDYRKKTYEGFVLRTSNTDPELYKFCSEFVKYMSELMKKTEIKEVCIHLPKAIDNQNAETIKMYKKKVDELCEKFSELKSNLEERLTNLITTFVTSETTDQQSIE